MHRWNDHVVEQLDGQREGPDRECIAGGDDHEVLPRHDENPLSKGAAGREHIHVARAGDGRQRIVSR